MAFYDQKLKELKESGWVGTYNLPRENKDDTNNLLNFFFIDIWSISRKRKVRFKAFINSFNDSLRLNWKTQEVGINRMDPFVNYMNSERVINIKFSVPAAQQEEAIDNFANLNLFKEFLYPNIKTPISGKFNSSNNVSPPLLKILFCNWIKDESNENFDSAQNGGLLGYIDGLSFDFNPGNQNFFFDSDKKMIPSHFEISFNFFVLNSGKDSGKEDFKFTRIYDNSQFEEHFSNLSDVVRVGDGGNPIIFKNPSIKDKVVAFDPFITSFSDKLTSNWNKIDVFAKTDKLATFRNTTRKINFRINVPARDDLRAKVNFYNIKNLFYLLSPQYDEKLKIKNVPFTQIKFGNWIKEAEEDYLLGFINQIEFVPNFESGFFAENNNKILIPYQSDLSIDFTVLHTRPLGFQITG